MVKNSVSAAGVCVWQAEAVTLTVAESFQIAKDIMEKESSCTEQPSTSNTQCPPHSLPSTAAVQQVYDVCLVTELIS